MELETFVSGDPLELALKGVEELSSSERRAHDTLQQPIENRYGTSVSQDTARVLEQLNNAIDAIALVEAVRSAGLNDETDDTDLGDVMSAIDVNLQDALCPRDSDAAKVTTKSQRERIYAPELENMAGDGDVYMAKTLTSDTKVRIAWDLHDDNQVVVVDEYEKWESLLDWKKLKSLPHGKNKIREELGDQLSDDVLSVVASERASDGADSSESDSNDGPSRGRRTRTKPSEEVLNVARGSRHRNRRKIKSKNIADGFDDGEQIGYKTEMLVLFPTTCDLNMTDHWWIAGKRWPGAGYVAIANCNKGTFEYLNQYEQVWHVEDYLDQASGYEFDTNAGPVTFDTASTDNMVIHCVAEDVRERLTRENVIDGLPEALVEYCEEELYSRRRPELPHSDDMVYAPITREDIFWLRPVLRKQQDEEDGDAVVLKGDESPRDIGHVTSVSSDYKLYARARLNEWDFDSPELHRLDKASHYMKLEKDGALELIETLGRLHDAGEPLYSQSPQERWS